jgi:hypothetical protein
MSDAVSNIPLVRTSLTNQILDGGLSMTIAIVQANYGGIGPLP